MNRTKTPLKLREYSLSPKQDLALPTNTEYLLICRKAREMWMGPGPSGQVGPSALRRVAGE